MSKKDDPLRVRDGHYWLEARYVNALGKSCRVQKTTRIPATPENYTAALLEAQRLLAEHYVSHGQPKKLNTGTYTIADAFRENLAAKLSEDRSFNTKRILARAQFHVERLLGAETRCDALNAQIYRAYVVRRKAEKTHHKPTANATIRRELMELNYGLKSLGLPIPEIPTLKLRECTRALNEAETRAALAATQTHADQTVADAFLVYRTAGIRLAEIFVIEQVDFARNAMFVNGVKTQGSARWVPMSDDVRAVMERRLAGKPPGTLPFIPRTKNSERNLLKQIVKVTKRAGVAHFSANDLRRSFAQELLIADETNTKVAAVLGHKSTRMVDKHYGRLNGRLDEIKDVVRSIRNYSGGKGEVTT